MSWSFDFSGKLEEVIEHVTTVQLTREQMKHVARVEEGATDEQLGEMDNASLRELVAEHLGDYERVRGLLLDELRVCRFPFAGVYAAWEDAPQHLGGYGLRFGVSGYEKDPRTS